LLLYVVLLLASAAGRSEVRNQVQVTVPSIPHARAAGPPTGRSFFWFTGGRLQLESSRVQGWRVKGTNGRNGHGMPCPYAAGRVSGIGGQ